MGITATNIVKRFGDFLALDDVTVDIPSGSLTALLGPSGGGKSTLLRVMAGLEPPDSGVVLLDGTDATALPPQRRNVGFVFQHYAAFKHLSVYRNVAFGLEIRKRPKDEIRRRVTELLELVHLEAFADRLPAQLSGGQRQRMALARALAVEPRILLLDEPFGALDAQVRTQLRLWLRDLHATLPVTTGRGNVYPVRRSRREQSADARDCQSAGPVRRLLFSQDDSDSSTILLRAMPVPREAISQQLSAQAVPRRSL